MTIQTQSLTKNVTLYLMVCLALMCGVCLPTNRGYLLLDYMQLTALMFSWGDSYDCTVIIT